MFSRIFFLVPLFFLVVLLLIIFCLYLVAFLSLMISVVFFLYFYPSSFAFFTLPAATEKRKIKNEKKQRKDYEKYQKYLSLKELYEYKIQWYLSKTKIYNIFFAKLYNRDGVKDDDDDGGYEKVVIRLDKLKGQKVISRSC